VCSERDLLTESLSAVPAPVLRGGETESEYAVASTRKRIWQGAPVITAAALGACTAPNPGTSLRAMFHPSCTRTIHANNWNKKR
jgi:hypothetical protein